MAELLLDSDVVIWHLRGHDSIVRHVTGLAHGRRLGLSAVTRAEVLQGMRPPEREATLALLDACETLPVDGDVADRAAALVRRQRSRGVTIPLPDALIAATAITAGVPLHTCNARHYPFDELQLTVVAA